MPKINISEKAERNIIIGVVAAVMVGCALVVFPKAASSDDFSLGEFLLSGLQDLFIPDRDYFDSFREEISNRFEIKFGSVTSAFGYLHNRFKGLREYNDLGGVFKVAFPNNSFLKGLSVNFLSVAGPVLKFVRECVTGLCCIVTAMLCYRKVIEMVNT